MYTYLSAYVKEASTGQRWRQEDVRNMPVFSILNSYSGVYLELQNNALPGSLTVDMSQVIDRIRNLPESLTVQQWLVSLGDQSLPHVQGAFTEETSTVRFKTSIAYGFKAELAFAGGNPLADVNDSEKLDVMLTKPGANYDTIYKTCLFTSNGFVHRHDADVLGIYIKDGGKTFHRKQSNKIGVLDFSAVGELEIIDIDADMLRPNAHTERLYDGMYIDLPHPIGNKIPMLVLGGYLHLVNTNYYQVGESTIKVEVNRIPLLKRIYESQGEIDITEATDLLEKSEYNEGLIDVDQLHGNEFLRSYFSMTNSFVVLVDAESIFLEKHKLGYTHLPGRYFDGNRPEWPMSLELGRLPEYIAFKDSDLWTLAIQSNLCTRYLFETKGWKAERLVDATPITYDPVYYSEGFLLEIGTSRLVPVVA